MTPTLFPPVIPSPVHHRDLTTDSAPSAETPRSSAVDPTVLRCTGTADFLAALPFLTGFTAENSLFLVIFAGRRSAHSVRVDLPASEQPADLLPFIDALCELLRRTRGGDSHPALVVSSARTFAESGGAPWRRLAARLRRRLHREGWRPREFACVAPDGWVSYLDPDAPALGRHLDAIRSSPIAATAHDSAPPPVSLDEIGRVRSACTPRTIQLATALEQLRASQPVDAGAGNDSVDGAVSGSASDSAGTSDAGSVAALRETVINAAHCVDDADADTEAWARLVHDASEAHRWLLIALSLVTRPQFVLEMLDESSDVFLTMPLEPDSRDLPAATPSLRGMLESMCSVLPDIPRLRRGITALTSVAAHTPYADRAPLLNLLSWAWWMLGMQSVAQHRSDDALRIDPHHALTQVIARLVELPPAWTWGTSE